MTDEINYELMDVQIREQQAQITELYQRVAALAGLEDQTEKAVASLTAVAVGLSSWYGDLRPGAICHAYMLDIEPAEYMGKYVLLERVPQSDEGDLEAWKCSLWASNEIDTLLFDPETAFEPAIS